MNNIKSVLYRGSENNPGVGESHPDCVRSAFGLFFARQSDLVTTQTSSWWLKSALIDPRQHHLILTPNSSNNEA